jgi:alanyl-tRNA synthetase
MQFRTGSQIREDFLRFFESKQHRRVHSSSLVPANDPTLLFTNAGMNQFKDVFLGAEQREYSRATTSQKCVRAGGKHNDLENVGFTRRHHTFFEMLGNFSFGDYFKKDAIAFAWELLTSPEWYAIPKDKLYVTIFEGDAKVPRDAEAYQFWLDVGVPKERIFELGAADNFWAMGDTGPCGPCSEIYFDLGCVSTNPEDDKPFGEDDDRYVEIWNLVFMQFDRATDGTLTPLPKPSIDTGMGLERIAAVLQGKLSNYETDLFIPLIARAAELTGKKLSAEEVAKASVSDDRPDASLRIISDHARAATFLINDGVVPANEGRGYVLRKIMRRGIRHGRLLGQEKPFLHEMVLAVRDEMQVAYPELAENAVRIAKIVLGEEEQFARVMERGYQALEEEFTAAPKRHIQNVILKYAERYPEPNFINGEELRVETQKLLAAYREIIADSHSSNYLELTDYADIFEEKIQPSLQSLLKGYVDTGDSILTTIAEEILETWPFQLSGSHAFHLYETFGMPLDFMVDAARDAGLAFDMAGFDAAKESEQQRARASWKGGSQKSASPVYRELAKTEFEGYSTLRVDGAKVLALVKDGQGVNSLAPGDEGEVVLNATSFYADSGGQVGDTGWLYSGDHNTIIAEVRGCTKPVQGVFAHRVIARQPIGIGDAVDTVVNGDVRRATIRNHTGTHLLHAALREVLGKHVKQAGSLVNPQRLRFDFAHFASVAEEELHEIEQIVNAQVLANTPVQTFVDVPIDEAINDLGAMALFGEKYGEKVRVIKIGDFSTELCGGIHTGATGEIGLIKLLGENSVSSGVRRVEAVTGTGSLAEFRRDFDVARMAARITGGGETNPAEALAQKISAQEDELKKLRRELDDARMKSASSSMENAADSAVTVKGVKVLAQRVDGLDKNQMRALVDTLRGKLGEGVVVLGAAIDGKVTLIAGVTKELTGKVQAGKIVGLLAAKVGGKGGGRPDLAEAGGTDTGALDATLASAAEVVGSFL